VRHFRVPGTHRLPPAYSSALALEFSIYFGIYTCLLGPFPSRLPYFIHSFIHSSMVLQPFVGPWPLLQFRNLFSTDARTPWTSDQPVGRPLPKHRTEQTQNKRTDIHALSGIRTHYLSVRASEDSSCFRPPGHCDRPIFLIEFQICLVSLRPLCTSRPESLLFIICRLNCTIQI
jgi:hypothetical protein